MLAFYEKAVEGLLLLLYPNSNSLLHVRCGPCPWHVGFWISQEIKCPVTSLHGEITQPLPVEPSFAAR